MAQRCDICGKGPASGNNVSHSNRHTRRRFMPNIRKVKVNQKGTVRSMKVCTVCLKSGKVVKVA